MVTLYKVWQKKTSGDLTWYVCVFTGSQWECENFIDTRGEDYPAYSLHIEQD